MLQKIQGMVHLLLCLTLALHAAADKVGDAIDTREKMAVEAATAVTEAYDTIRQSGISAASCKDVTDYSFPDMCMPNEEYKGEYPVVDVDKDGNAKETRTQTYDDTRPKDGKNSPKNMKFNEAFGINTGAYLGYKIQPKTPQTAKVKKEMCAAQAAGSAFDRNAKGDTVHGELASTTSWQYFGGQETGLFAQYPASVKHQCWCDGYDPRYRPWYAAAVTGPKDFVMVLDVSGSMATEVQTEGRTETRLSIMKTAAKAQLDTITFSDFVQVVIYSSGASSYNDESTLMRGTADNKKKLMEFIDKVEAKGSTCGKCGIQKAFEIFRDSTTTTYHNQNSAGCTKIITFLTDGKMNDASWSDWGTWLDSQKQSLQGANPHIFTYALGSGADEAIPKRLACENRGWYAKVNDGDVATLKHAMIRYFEYFANKIPSGNASMIPRWTEFYQDSSGQGKMTTVALPVYANDISGHRIFHGVVGIDVLASDFGASLDDSALAVKLQQRSAQCVSYNFSIPEDTNVVGQCQITERNPSGPYVPTGATINEVDDGHCSGANAGAIIAIVFSVLFCVCCCGIGIVIARKRRGNKPQTINKPPVNHAVNVQMTRTVQHNQAPNQMGYGNNGSMMVHQNGMYQNGHRISVVQQPMQQPMYNNGMGQPVVVQAQHLQAQQPYGNNQVPIMTNQGTPVVVQAIHQPVNAQPRQSL